MTQGGLNDLALLLERVSAARDLSEACSILLDALALEAGVERAVLVVRGGRGAQAAAYGVDQPRAAALLARGRAAESLLDDESGSEILRALGVQAPTVLTIASAAGDALGALIVDARDGTPPVAAARATLQRFSPILALVARIESTQERVRRLDRQRDLLTFIVNTLDDPVLLTDARNEILLANRRAEHLFSATPDDSEGRRRAIQVNNLLFSSFLTKTVISSEAVGGRELNLVDPSEGSDLLFEVLSLPAEATLAGEGTVISILRDITDLKRAVAELESQFKRSRSAEHHARRERDQLNVVLENVGDPILVTDDASNIILLNREAERLFVVSPAGEPEGRNPRLVRANDTRFTSLINDFLLRTDARRVEKIALSDPDTNRDFAAEVVSSKILNSRGEPTAIVSVVHDLTQVVENERLARELRQLNDELEDRIRRATEELEEHNRRLEWQSHELEKAYQLKSEFLASMSHELRTPINVILGYTSLMRERIYGELTGQQQEALGKVYTTSQHLLELISDILDLSKIEAGKMPVHLEEVMLPELIHELSQTVEPMLQKKRLRYVADVERQLPIIRTDRTKLKQILLNLLSNAIKFTHEGEVGLRAAIAAGGQRVRIDVRDSGIGIKAEHLKMIFDDFRQVDQSPTREYGGTGLGLSITKKLLTLLGGSIEVESAYGVGTTFSVELPVVAEAIPVEDQVQRVRGSDPSMVRR